jgi:hypothetical protein
LSRDLQDIEVFSHGDRLRLVVTPIACSWLSFSVPAMGSVILSDLNLQRMDLQIVSDFPEVFREFRGKQFSLLLRGNRDGLGGPDFHNRCHRHANTRTVILDTDGSIFGGFNSAELESRKWNRKVGDKNNLFKADDNLKSFVFVLKNPINFLIVGGSRRTARPRLVSPLDRGCHPNLDQVIGILIVIHGHCSEPNLSVQYR